MKFVVDEPWEAQYESKSSEQFKKLDQAFSKAIQKLYAESSGEAATTMVGVSSIR